MRRVMSVLEVRTYVLKKWAENKHPAENKELKLQLLHMCVYTLSISFEEANPLLLGVHTHITRDQKKTINTRTILCNANSIFL